MAQKSRPEHFATWEQDMRFIEAMCNASIRGEEHPPMIGVDTRPCTTNPRRIEAQVNDALRIQSALGDLSTSGT